MYTPNSAHLYFNRIKAELSVPVVNMIEAVVQRIEHQGAVVAILATEPTDASGLYQAALGKRHIKVLNSKPFRADLNALIAACKKPSGSNRRQAVDFFSKHLEGRVATTIIACTDLSSTFSDINVKNMQFIDSSQCLVDEILDKYC